VAILFTRIKKIPVKPEPEVDNRIKYILDVKDKKNSKTNKSLLQVEELERKIYQFAN
jgi:hypothetical protein